MEPRMIPYTTKEQQEQDREWLQERLEVGVAAATISRDIADVVRLLARLEAARHIQEKAAQEAERAMHATPEGQRLRSEAAFLAELGHQVDSLDQLLRESALEFHKLTENKHPHDAISVILRKKVTITDETALIDYAIEKLRLLLKVDVSQVKKFAELVNLPGVEVTKEPAVRVKQDLSEYAEE